MCCSSARRNCPSSPRAWVSRKQHSTKVSLRAHLQRKTLVKIKLKDLWKKVVKVTSMVMEYQILRTKIPEYQIQRTTMRVAKSLAFILRHRADLAEEKKMNTLRPTRIEWRAGC